MPAKAPSSCVLIVEDVFMVRRTLELILKSGGYKVIEAPETVSAMNILKQGAQVDLILLDVNLPGIDGLKFGRVLKAFEPTKDIPVIMCTARGDSATVAEARQFGAVDFIVKPFSKETVLEKVGRALKEIAEKKKPEQKPKGKKGKKTT